MSVPRIILRIEQPESFPATYVLSEEEHRDSFHHLRRVRRIKVHDKVEILEWESPLRVHCEVSSLSSDSIELKRLEVEHRDAPPKVRIILGVPEFERVEYLVEKLTELEVTELIFFPAELSQGKSCLDKIKARLDRLERIRDSSRIQCGSRVRMKFTIQLSLENALRDRGANEAENRFSFIGSLLPEAFKLQEYLNKISSLECSTNSADVFLIIGPEGGLTGEEEDYSKNCGFIPIGFGSSILRVDTAAICGAFSLIRAFE